MAIGENTDYNIEGTIGLLFIEPSAKVSDKPLIDILTKKMTAAYRQMKLSDIGYMGVHICRCGATSGTRSPYLPKKYTTNSLCIHYLAYHRDDIPQNELDKAASLNYGEEEPTEGELNPPSPSPHKNLYNRLKGIR